jgi:hypothetical protein
MLRMQADLKTLLETCHERSSRSRADGGSPTETSRSRAAHGIAFVTIKQPGFDRHR